MLSRGQPTVCFFGLRFLNNAFVLSGTVIFVDWSRHHGNDAVGALKLYRPEFINFDTRVPGTTWDGYFVAATFFKPQLCNIQVLRNGFNAKTGCQGRQVVLRGSSDSLCLLLMYYTFPFSCDVFQTQHRQAQDLAMMYFAYKTYIDKRSDVYLCYRKTVVVI